MITHTFSSKAYGAVIVLFFFLCPFFIFAAPKYSVAPLVIDEKLEGRDIVVRKISVTNTGDQPVTLYPTVNNISLNEGGVIQKFLSPVESDRTQSLASWIEIKRLGIDMKPGETKEFDVTLRVNPNPLPGTYHAFIGFGYGRNRDEAEVQVKEGQAPGSIVTVTIEDKKTEALKLSGFTVERFITKKDNQGATFSFINPGDEILIPKGEIILYNSKGKEVGSIPVNDENVAISPGDEHTFTATLPADGFGKFKAYLTVEYGLKQKVTVNDTNFYYVIPIRMISIVLGIIVILVGFFAWFFHKRYFDPDAVLDDGERLTFHIKDTNSDAKEHDVVVKQK